MIDRLGIRYEVVIYTCMIGGYDHVPMIPNVDPGVQYFAFTDSDSVPSPWVNMGPPDTPGMNNRRLSRMPKLLPHVFLPDHGVSIWMDSNLILKRPILKFAMDAVRDHDVAIFRHPRRNCIFEEAKVCARLGLDGSRLIMDQMESYRREKMPQRFGLPENCFMIRRNTPAVRDLNAMWWQEYYRGSQRDQLSLMYCVWKLGMKINIMNGNSRNNEWYQQLDHLKPRKAQA